MIKVRESNSIKSVEHPGWNYWEMPEDYKGPWEPSMYTKEVGELLLTIYPPQYDMNSSIPSYTDDYHAQIEREDAHQGDLDCYVTGFETFEDAEDFINKKLDGYVYVEANKSGLGRGLEDLLSDNGYELVNVISPNDETEEASGHNDMLGSTVGKTVWNELYPRVVEIANEMELDPSTVVIAIKDWLNSH